MKSKAIISAIAALSMGISGLAVAQVHSGEHHGGDTTPPDQRVYDRNGNSPYDGSLADRHDNDRRDNGRHYGERRDDRGHHHWRRGDRLPTEYRSRQYVVDDWRGHHLSAPPRGYHWVQANGDYVLVAIATGVIASILLNQ